MQTMAVENRESEDIGREGTDPLLSPGGYVKNIEDRQTADSLWKAAKHASGNPVALPDSKTTTNLVQRMIGIQGTPFRYVHKNTAAVSLCYAPENWFSRILSIQNAGEWASWVLGSILVRWPAGQEKNGLLVW